MRRILFLSISLIFIYSSTLQAQQYLDWIQQAEEGTPLSEIQESAETYFQNRDKGRGSGYKQYKRWEYLAQDHLNAEGELVNFSRLTWDVAHEFSAHSKKEELDNLQGCQASWSILAPLEGYTTSQGGYNPGVGRVNVIAFDPSDANTIYVGTPAGGLWKTTTQGNGWTPLTDHLPSIGVSGIVIHPLNPNLIHILTGDGDGADTYCLGVLRSLDGGNTWEETGLTFGTNQFVRPYKLTRHPNDPDMMLAVTSLGIFRTTDAGNSWVNVQEGHFVDIEFNPANPAIQFATTKSVLYRSDDSGASWNFISSTTGLPTGEERVAIAVSPANPDYLYVFAGPAVDDGVFKGLYRSVDGGLSFSLQTNTPNVLGHPVSGEGESHQTWYDLAIAVDPDDAETVITGGVNVWRSVSGGESMEIISHWNFNGLSENGLQYTHADIHELIYNPVDGSLWCGSDGGAFVSFDDGLTWEDRSSLGGPGLAITQFYRISSFPGSPVILGGAQDNGSNRWEGGDHIIHFDGADGMDCMIHPTDSTIQYHTRQSGRLRKSTNGGQNHFGIRPGQTLGYWVTPLAMDPNDPEVIYAAYEDTVYRSANGGSDWVGSVPQNGVGYYRSLHVAHANPEVIYAATVNNIFVSQDAGATWANISAGITPGTITRIATDRDNADEVWVTQAGYSPNNKVFYSSDAGTTWENVTGSLPNLPVNCIVYDPFETGGDNAVYIGMDVGVFYRDSSLNDWAPYFTGLPNVPVFDLEIHEASGMLQAGTYGRGIWQTPLYQPDEETPSITCPDPQILPFGVNCSLIMPNLTGLASATDNCDPNPDIVQVPAPGTEIFQDTTITLTALDWEGNEDICTFALSLEDTSAPVLSCPGDMSVYSCEGIVEYEVLWEDNCTASEGELIEGLASGEVFPVDTTTVSWLASDENGNESTCSFSVIVINSLDINLSSDASCPNESTGEAFVQVNSGIPPFAFLWDDPFGQSTDTAIGLAAGSYGIWVSDSLGCIGIDTILIESTPAVDFVVDTVANEVSSQSNGFIDVTITGGLSPLAYLWKKDGVVISMEEDLDSLAIGEYQLEVTDANGCVFISQVIQVDNLTSVTEVAPSHLIRVYPNPGSDFFRIEWLGAEEEAIYVELMDIKGSVLWHSLLEKPQQEIPVSHLAPGSYQIHLSTSRWGYFEKVVIIR